jgi:hypothetical protein
MRGDQPLMGCDAGGLYIATNAFLARHRKPRAQLYPMPKGALAAGYRR